jgi:hypothetical protein
MLFLVSPPADSIRQLVGYLSEATLLAISTRVLARRRSLPTPGTVIQQLAQRRCCSTRPARPTRPRGTQSLYSNGTGSGNTATGDAALFSNTTGDDNTATGTAALFFNRGNHNTASGRAALFENTIGGDNTAIGHWALLNNTSGSFNTATGTDALLNNTTGTHNTALGYFAGSDVTGTGNVCIGANVNGDAGVNDTTWVKNVNTVTQNFAAGVNDYVTVRLNDGRLGHTAVVSSRRYKEDIKPLAAASKALYALKPVSFRLKKEYDETQALGFGLIAEEVEKVDSALVYRNNQSQAESVRYEMVNAMLLNEFLKEHKKVEQGGNDRESCRNGEGAGCANRKGERAD